MKENTFVLTVATLALCASMSNAQASSSKTVTGPNGKTATRSATSSGGQTNVTTTGPKGSSRRVR